MLKRLRAWLCAHNVHLVRTVISGDIEGSEATIVKARRCVWCGRLWVEEVNRVNLEESL